MPNVVQPTIEKVLPKPAAAPKKPATKADPASFKTELKKARPKPVQAEVKPAPKKVARAARPEKKDAKAEAPPTDAPPTDEVQTPDAEVVSEDQAVGVPEEEVDEKPKADEPKAQLAETDQPIAIEPDPATLLQSVNPEAKQDQPQPKEDADAEQVATKRQAVTTAPQPVEQTETADATEPAIVEKTSKDSDGSDVETAQETVVAATDIAVPIDTETGEEQDAPPSDEQPVAKAAAKKPAAVREPVQAEKSEAALPADNPQPQKAELAVQPESRIDADDNAPATRAVAEISDHADVAPPVEDLPARASHVANDTTQAFDLQPKAQSPAPAARPEPPAPPAPPAPPEVRFAETNHPQIVSGMRGQLLPDGGTMHIRLDPPELGALQVSLHMQDGVMSASFQTSNDDATRLLSHSLAQLKNVLESQGVSVDKLHVTQTPRDQDARNDDNGRQQGNSDNPSARQEQQRREILQRMWRRLTNGSDPLDMVA